MVDYSTQTLDAAYSALASDVRRAIVAQLVERDRRVTELARPFDVTLQAISKHVRVLEAAGLVRRRIEGRDHWLSLDPEPLAAAGSWIETTRRFWESRLDALDALLAESGPSGPTEPKAKRR
jgi:DNA-binding transcriptional ArsR family regulator